jgi:molecular chaperone HscA
VEACEQGSGVLARVEVKPSYGLTDDEIARMLKESFSTAEVDMKMRALTEARVDAERLALATESALAADGDLLDDPELGVVRTLIAELRESATCEDAATIEGATQALARGTEEFAARRMNRGIQQVLAGRNVETL